MFPIGKLAAETGVKVPTIRYYEEIGLLPEAQRSEGNQRHYGRADRDRLNFIRHSRELGFPLADIRELLCLSDHPDQSCAAADIIAKRQLKAVERRVARLMKLQAELERMVSQCAGGCISECRVIESLSDHGHCSADHEAA